MDKLVEIWQSSREKLKEELASIEGKKGKKKIRLVSDGDAEVDTKQLMEHLQLRISELDDLIGATRGSRDDA